MQILFLVLFFLSCIASTSNAQKERTMSSDITINDVKGTIKRLSPNLEWWVIIPDEKEIRYTPSNLPGEFKKDGLRVIYSGKIGKIPSDVRMIGTPLELIKIEKLDEDEPN